MFFFGKKKNQHQQSTNTGYYDDLKPSNEMIKTSTTVTEIPVNEINPTVSEQESEPKIDSKEPTSDIATTNEIKTGIPDNPVVLLRADEQVEENLSPEEMIIQTQLKFTEIVEQYNQTQTKLQEQLFAQQTEIEERIKRNRISYDELIKSQQDLVEKEAELKKVDDHKLEDQISDVNISISDDDYKISEINDQISNQQEHLNVVTESLRKLQNEASELNSQQDSITTKMHSVTDPSDIIKLADQYRNQISGIEEGLKDNHASQTKLIAKQDNLNKKIEGLYNSVQQLKIHRSTLTDEISNLEEMLTQNRGSRKDQLIDIKRKLEFTKNDIGKVQFAYNQSQDDLSNTKDMIMDWIGTPYSIKPFNTADEQNYVLALDSFLPGHASELTKIVQRLFDLGVKKIGLFTSYLDVNLMMEIDQWREMTGLDKEQVYIINALYSLQGTEESTSEPIILPIDGVTEKWNSDHTKLKIRMRESNWEMEVTYRQATDNRNDSIMYIDYFRKGILNKRSYCDINNHLAANAIYNEKGQLEREEYFHRNGTLVLSVNYENNEILDIELFDQSGLLQTTFNNVEELNSWWLNKQFAKEAILIGDIRDSRFSNLSEVKNMVKVPFLTEETLGNDSFNKFINEKKNYRFAADSYDTEQAIIQKAKRSIELLSLRNTVLPVLLSTPKIKQNY